MKSAQRESLAASRLLESKKATAMTKELGFGYQSSVNWRFHASIIGLQLSVTLAHKTAVRTSANLISYAKRF